MKLRRWLFGILIGVVVGLTVAVSNVQAVVAMNAWSMVTDNIQAVVAMNAWSMVTDNIQAVGATNVRAVAQSSASAQNFTIGDYTADYYLTKDEQGVSNLHVKETIVAEFPSLNQNHGITRLIPRTNQDGANYTVRSKGELNFSATRNGLAEPVAQFEENSDEYIIYLGDASQYVHGTQTYVLEYDFNNVITAFDASNNNVSGEKNAMVAFQELYWDTNGTGWRQPIENLTARLHFADDIEDNLERNQTSCYVGVQGASGSAAQARCKTKRTSDGYIFSTTDLFAGENLTFAVDFEPNTFKIIIQKDYSAVIFLAIELVVGGAIFFALFRWWKKKAAPNWKLYKSIFVTTEYLPPKDLTVAEAAQVYLKRVKSTYVATLLEMAVKRKVTIKSLSDKKWSVVLNVAPDALEGAERDMLNIIAYRTPLAQGVEIPIERHFSTYSAQQAARDYLVQSCESAEKKGLIRASFVARQTAGRISLSVFIFIIIFVFVFSSLFLSSILDFSSFTPGGRLVGGPILLLLDVGLIFALIVGGIWFGSRVSTYGKYTEAGIKMARYLEGLEQYIKLAEDKRLEFMQSVKGADTSTEGLVHLYEKLLPWACLFGVEKSWAAELDKYYRVLDESGSVYERTYSPNVMRGIVIGNMASRLNSTMSSSSSSSASNSSSGGGGGGSSGGGGGGGGGGGW